jgi:hypothetical protein
MGFGLLFIGYFIATLMSVHIYGAYVSLVGYGIVFIASVKLSKYNSSFRFLEAGAILMIVTYGLISASGIASFLYDEMLVSTKLLGDSFDSIMGKVEMAVSFLFVAAMLWAIRAIAKETNVEKIVYNSARNFVFLVVYYVLFLISYLPFDFTTEYIAAFGGFVTALNFVIIVLNLVLIFSCYARICDENDVDMAQKPSRFAFVNKYRAESERRREKAMKEREEYETLKAQRKNKKR